MEKTPKSLRLQIGLFGRTNVGKSSFLNMVAGQDVSITSPIPGTTTDVVEKTMELLPIGPVVFLDTAGLDDKSALGKLRLRKTRRIFDRSDVIVLLTESGAWGSYEDGVIEESKKRDIPVLVAVNKIDIAPPGGDFIKMVEDKNLRVMTCSSAPGADRDTYVNPFKKHLIELCPDDFLNPPPLIGDLLPPDGLAVLIIPIDKEAPKGRIILPQVQTIRDCLDNGQSALVVREKEYAAVLSKLKRPPDIVVCDSQVVARMVKETPRAVMCTTFSILFARYKGDLTELARGAAYLDSLKHGDRVMIAESCSHHPIADDIGRVKIPKWLNKYAGGALKIDVCSGRDYPETLVGYKLVIHCGGCMITRREMLCHIERAVEQRVPITNYGVLISALHGAAERTLFPFPEALAAFTERKKFLSKTHPKDIKSV